MTLDKELLNNLVNITSSAAISSFPHIGKKNKELADKAATDDMRKNLNKLDINGEVVIGEGELDEAPMLYIGEKLGTGKGPFIDIAVDPVEGTNFVANNLPGALSVIAVSNKGNLFHAPETYMNKIAVGNDVPIDAVDLDFSVEKNIKNIADVKNKDIKKITACLLDTDQKHDVDVFLGIGGGPEGVLAASALDAFECKFQGRFLFKTAKDINRAKKMGINDINKKYDLKEIVKEDSIFCATGITNGDLVKGIEYKNNIYISETLITHKAGKLTKIIRRENILKT